MRIALALLVAVVLAPVSAWACINEIHRTAPPNDGHALVVKLESWLEAKRYADILGRGRVIEVVQPEYQSRARYVLAVAELRTGAFWSAASDFEKAMAGASDSRLPLIQALWAEAAVGCEPHFRDVARAILIDLDRKDMMPDAESYALLATLLRDVGDERGAEAALSACRKRAANAEVCEKAPVLKS